MGRMNTYVVKHDWEGPTGAWQAHRPSTVALAYCMEYHHETAYVCRVSRKENKWYLYRIEEGWARKVGPCTSTGVSASS